ncbi:MAG: PAS domain-containing protein [Anaerolineales bacterium]|jgi:PAS domain S-box-containing protein|nr:PAS domain-containing protein [Chloroflexota bacterium]MBK6646175.1 PAS domain-containing protein [Anaerolineales bacterium]
MKTLFQSAASKMDMRILILAVLLTALTVTSILAVVDVNRPFLIGLSFILLFSIGLTWAGKTAIGSWVALTSSLLVLSILIYRNNGIRDTAILGLIVVLLASGLLAGRPGTIIIGCIIIIEAGVYGAFEMAGIINNPFSGENDFSDYLAAIMLIALITALQWLVISRLQSIIQSAEADLMERMKIQNKLQETEARYRGLVESIPAAVYMAEPGLMGAWHFISPRIQNMTGFPPEAWTNDPGFWQSRVHPDDLELTLAVEDDALKNGRMPRLEYRFQKKDGGYIWFHDESLIMVEANSQIVQGIMLDITDQKQAEEQLNRHIAELEAVHGISESLIQKTDLQKLIQDTGEQLRRLLKADNLLIAIHDPNTNLIHFPYDFDAGIPRRDIPIRFGEGMTTRVMEGRKPVIIESDWIKRSAAMNAINTNSLPAKSSVAVPIMTNERVIGIISLESIEREYAFNENDAQLLMTIASNLAVAVEKTRLQDSIKHELEIQEKLVRELEQKNEELERFTYTASHDLKSPLITIRGFLGYLEQDARQGNFDRLGADVQRISEAADKMQRLLSELLELSRIGKAANEKQDVPFEEIAAEALRRVEGQIKKKQVEVRIGSGFPIVRVDRERIVELIQNLVDNAVKFTGSQPQPIIEIGCELEDGRPIFHVRDNGIGIKKEFQKRIFGLFDKLDPATEGTGVGLALVKRIVEVHGGSIWVDSEEGKGATFYFTLGNNQN